MASSGLRTFGHSSPLPAARPSSLSRRLILHPGCRCCFFFFFFFFFFGVCTGPVCLPCCPLSDRRAGATSLALLTSDSQPLAGSLVGTRQISEPVWVRPGCQRPRCLCAKGTRWKSRSVRSVSHSCLRVLFTVSDRPGPQSLTSVKWTTLCNTSLDNPTQRSKDQLIQAAIKFLDTDTICYRVEEPETLVELQKNEWDPVIEWAENRDRVRGDPAQVHGADLGPDRPAPDGGAGRAAVAPGGGVPDPEVGQRGVGPRLRAAGAASPHGRRHPLHPPLLPELHGQAQTPAGVRPGVQGRGGRTEAARPQPPFPQPGLHILPESPQDCSRLGVPRAGQR
ncbi:uncharacterized protein [Oryctolagus cuniculus]|uniref:uncharacterized protein isoform X2 n=1 Tax=Oryctolagus cuniculus TaxID=9986 RepID=UPI003879E4C0